MRFKAYSKLSKNLSLYLTSTFSGFTYLSSNFRHVVLSCYISQHYFPLSFRKLVYFIQNQLMYTTDH